VSKLKFPITVKRGHTVVKIYRTPSRGCEAYTVSYYLGNLRQRRTFADLGMAQTEADTIATKLSSGEVKVLELTGEDRLSYVRFVEIGKATGHPLEVVAMYFAQAMKILGDGQVIPPEKLIEAAQYFKKRHPSGMLQKTVPDILKELIDAKEQDGVSDVYIKDLKGRLKRFAGKFTGKIDLVTAKEIEGWLRGLKTIPKREDETPKPLSGKSRNNYRRAIATLFNYAEAHGYLARGLGEMDGVALAKVDHGAIEIFTPAEMRAVLATANEKLIPFLAIGAFAGLRHAELQRLEWQEVHFDAGLIEVKAEKAKTASRRLVPMAENLQLWLKDHKKANGPICDYANVPKQLQWLAEEVDQKQKQKAENGKLEAGEIAEFRWKHNALRHSFISYRVAQVNDVPKVALEAGNSPRMVFSHYRELVRPVEAEKWFGIKPESKK
jgi:integrase